MKNKITLTIVALSFVLCAAQFALAQDKPIDDFTTGAYQSKPLTSGTSNRSTVAGSMMGGSRDTDMSICDPTKKGECALANPYKQPSSYGFFPDTNARAASMVQTAGYGVGPRI